MSTNQPIENIGKKVFDPHDSEARKALISYVHEEFFRTLVPKPPPFHRDYTHPIFRTVSDVFRDALDGASSIEEVLAAVPENFQLVSYSIRQFLEANGYSVPTSKESEVGENTGQKTISQLFVSVTEAVSDVLSVPVQEVQRAWVAARQKAKEKIEAETGARPGAEVPDNVFLDVLPDAHPLGAEIRFAILQRLRGSQQ
jgi:hypothetical protein